MSRPGVMLYFSILPALDSLPPASAGTLLLAAMHYAQDGKEPIFDDGVLTFAWAFLKPMIEKDGEAYDVKKLRGEWLTYCRKCKQDNVSPLDFETWRERTVTEPLQPDTDTTPITIPNTIPTTNTIPVTNNSIGADKPPARHKFSPPSVDDVSTYCQEQGYSVDPEKFIDYYTANGWKVGKNPMKDWRATVRNWSRKDGNYERTGKNEFSSLGTIGTVL